MKNILLLLLSLFIVSCSTTSYVREYPETTYFSNLPTVSPTLTIVTYNSPEFTMSYGYPEDEDDIDSVEKLIGLTYRFDNGVSLEIPKINGWSLGEKINQNIKKRKRNKNIESLLKIN